MDTTNISHASSTKKAGFVCSYVWDTGTLSFVAMTQPLIKTDTLTIGGSVAVSNMIPAVETGLATSAKQLADNHQVNVSNTSLAVTGSFYPATQPVSGTVSVSNMIPAVETGLATSAKQDTLLTELQLKADLTEIQPVYDETNNLLVRELLEQNNVPLWFDPTTGCLKVSGAGQTFATVTTVGTVTVVTGQTNIGGIPADPMVPNMINQTWALGVRDLLI